MAKSIKIFHEHHELIVEFVPENHSPLLFSAVMPGVPTPMPIALPGYTLGEQTRHLFSTGEAAKTHLLANGMADVAELKAALSPEFKFLVAAGGLVFDPQGRLLMIHRKGFWDLPKGKVEPGEALEETALREVEEETGAGPLKITHALGSTYHVYPEASGQWVLKESVWYQMEQTGHTDLVPQTEEDIAQAVWLSREEVAEKLPLAYSTIRHLVEAHWDRFPG